MAPAGTELTSWNASRYPERGGGCPSPSRAGALRVTRGSGRVTLDFGDAA
jgi:hypothetical protein